MTLEEKEIEDQFLEVRWDKFNKVWVVERHLNGKCIGCWSYSPEELDANDKQELIDVTSKYLAWLAGDGLSE